MSSWGTFAICQKCFYIMWAPFASKFHVHYECCPKCAARKDDWCIETCRSIHVKIREVPWWKFWDAGTTRVTQIKWGDETLTLKEYKERTLAK